MQPNLVTPIFDSQVLKLLDNIPFFDGLPKKFTENIANNAEIANYTARHILLKAGDAPRRLIIVLAGRVQLNEIAEDGRVIGIAFAGPNDLLAWLSMINNKPASQTLLTVGDCKVLMCPLGLIQQFASEDALVANRFLKLAANSIYRLEQARALLSLPNAYHRVFVQISLLFGDARSSTAYLPSHQDIASSVNTSRETVSRALGMLVKKGVLRKAGHRFVIEQAETLNKLAIDGP